jgi:acetyl-CoA carboxylase carboxyl transferase subunit alpha
MAAHYLDFERPIADLEEKIEELSDLSAQAGPGSLDAEIAALKARAHVLRGESYAQLDTSQKMQVARHPERPHCLDYIAGLIDEFVELRGDRHFADDQAIIGGLGRFRGQPVLVIGQEKGHDTATRVKHSFGLVKPEGYRKAVRLMDLAERYNLPVISFVDTGGAYPGIAAEERNQGEAIARSIERCLTLGTPMIATVTGEGGSGGALAIASANKVLMLEHSIYSVATPEASASILRLAKDDVPKLAESMKITAQELLKMRVIDRIIDEPIGGAHSAPKTTIKAVGDVVEEELRGLSGLSPDQVRSQRSERFYAIGRTGLA